MPDPLSRLAAKLSPGAAARRAAATAEESRLVRDGEDRARESSVRRARAAAEKLRRRPRRDV